MSTLALVLLGAGAVFAILLCFVMAVIAEIDAIAQDFTLFPPLSHGDDEP